jgi:hypothetical protein
MEQPPVTICLTAISARMGSVGSTLCSLLAQDYPEFSVRLYLSREAFLLDAGIPGRLPREIADLCAGSERMTIRFVPNIGPYRKILPFLSETRGRRCLVATADDDTIYPEDWLLGLVKAFRQHRCVICYRGHFMRRENRRFRDYQSWMRGSSGRNPDLFNLPTGKDGVLYDTSFFHPAVLNYARALSLARTADDLWLKWHYSALEDVPTFVINSDCASQSFQDHAFGDSLYRSFNRDGGNDAAVERLEDYTRARRRRAFAERN